MRDAVTVFGVGAVFGESALWHGGALWFGTIDNGEVLPAGRFNRCARGKCGDTGLPPVAITNGPTVTDERRTLYPVETLGKTNWRVAINDDASLGSFERHVVIKNGAGNPDGAMIDAEGCLWTGIYGGWGARCYNPAERLVTSVRFPVANGTKMAFGGPGLRTACATTARKGLAAVALHAQPHAGDIFAFDPGVA